MPSLPLLVAVAPLAHVSAHLLPRVSGHLGHHAGHAHLAHLHLGLLLLLHAHAHHARRLHLHAGHAGCLWVDLGRAVVTGGEGTESVVLVCNSVSYLVAPKKNLATHWTTGGWCPRTS